jgi:hypothetical protein
MGNFKSRQVKNINGAYTPLCITAQSVKDHNKMIMYYKRLSDHILEGISLNIPRMPIERFSNIVLN